MSHLEHERVLARLDAIEKAQTPHWLAKGASGFLGAALTLLLAVPTTFVAVGALPSDQQARYMWLAWLISGLTVVTAIVGGCLSLAAKELHRKTKSDVVLLREEMRTYADQHPKPVIVH